MKSLYQVANQSAKQAVSEEGVWLTGVHAIVADNEDPERQHRIRCVIPSIDEDEIYDEWARQMVFCLGNKRGAVFIPPRGSEVVLFGYLGQKHNLYYASLYSEDMLIPSEFTDTKDAGFHTEGNLILISDKTIKAMAEKIELLAEEVAQLKADNVKIEGGIVTIDGDVVKIHNRVVSKIGGAI